MRLTTLISLGTSSTGPTIADALEVIPATVTTTGVYCAYPDHLNSARILNRSSDNKMVWRWDNADPFGMAPPGQNPTGVGTFVYRPRFPGQMHDKESNNHYNYYRDYDPQTGRYIERDPLGLEGGINSYAYVQGPPALC